MKNLIALLFLLILSIDQLFAQDTWIRKADFPDTAVWGAFGFSIGGEGYIGGGYNSVSHAFWQYDASSDSWTQKADFKWPMGYGFSIDSDGYVVYYNQLWEYDPLTNIWSQKSNTPSQAYFGFSIGMKGYALIYDSLNFWEYDPFFDSWTQKAIFPGYARGEPIAFSIGIKGYMGTGGGGNWALSDLWEYNQSTDFWSKKASIPTRGRLDAVAFAIYGKGYVGTGNDSIGRIFSDFWQYDPINDNWTQVAGFGPLTSGVGFSIGNYGYVGTGTVANLVLNEFWQYTPILGIEDKHDNHVRVYPNPFKTSAFVQIEDKIEILNRTLFQLFSVKGDKVQEFQIKNSFSPIERSNLKAGTYIYCISDYRGKILCGKLIIID